MQSSTRQEAEEVHYDATVQQARDKAHVEVYKVAYTDEDIANFDAPERSAYRKKQKGFRKHFRAFLRELEPALSKRHRKMLRRARRAQEASDRAHRAVYGRTYEPEEIATLVGKEKQKYDFWERMRKQKLEECTAEVEAEKQAAKAERHAREAAEAAAAAAQAGYYDGYTYEQASYAGYGYGY